MAEEYRSHSPSHGQGHARSHARSHAGNYAHGRTPSRTPDPTGADSYSWQALRQINLFRKLDDGLLAAIGPLIQWRPAPRGQVLFYEGDPVQTLYILATGRVKVTAVSDEGKEQILNLFGPGDVFPHVGFFEAGVYPATARVIEDARVGLLTRDTLLELAGRHAKLAVQLLVAMEDRIRQLQDRLKDLVFRNLEARVARVLLQLTEEDPRPPFPLTQQELAAIAGGTRESISRILSAWRRQGFIQMGEQGQILSLDRRALLRDL